MTFTSFVEWAFLGVSSGGVWVLWQMKNSVQELNVKVAVMLERMDGHEKRITKLEETN